MKQYTRVLTIAGSDSGGGAGIQADIKTISALGCYAASAITAVTVQNTIGVSDIHVIPSAVVEAQIEAVLSDIGADAVKVGMLHSSDIVEVVIETLRRHPIPNVVIDPVMVSTSGHRLLEASAVELLVSSLIPLAKVITPNLPEAEVLLGRSLSAQDDMPDAACELACRYGVSVLLKAGHLIEDELVDYFFNVETDELLALPSRRIYTENTHGTGCTMSSALASLLAKGFILNDAVRGAKKYINEAILFGAQFKLGHGHGPVDHFYAARNQNASIEI